MQKIISRCGYTCSDCPWSMYVRQRINKNEWEEYSRQVKKFLGFAPAKVEWEGCVGCLTPNEQFPKHPHYNFLKGCSTRTCVMINEIETCAHCSRFPCANTLAGLEVLKLRREVLQRLLWITGTSGKLANHSIIVDSISLNKNKKTAKLPSDEKSWQYYLDILTKIGLISKLVIETLMNYIHQVALCVIGFLKQQILHII
jgi:hypothetical protein